MQTVRESGMSASGSVSQESSNTSPCFTAICGQPFTHQSAPPVCRTSKAPSDNFTSFTASFSRAHARRSLNAQAFTSAPSATKEKRASADIPSTYGKLCNFILFLSGVSWTPTTSRPAWASRRCPPGASR